MLMQMIVSLRSELQIPKGLMHDLRNKYNAYRLQGWDGEITMDRDEVQAFRWEDMRSIYQDVSCHPEMYTSWLKAELELLQQILLTKD